MKDKEKEKKEGKQQNSGQPESLLGNKGKSVTEKADNTKQKIQKIKKIINFLKKHPLIAKLLFWLILAITVVILITMIIYAIIGEEEESASASYEAILQEMGKTLPEAGSETVLTQNSNTRKSTGGTIKKNDGEGGDNQYYYYLLYGEDYDSEPEKSTIVKNLKSKLEKRGFHIYNNQCLLFLAILEKNGLNLSLYNQSQLEAMYMYFKAEVATSSLDLRTKDERESNAEPLKDQIVPASGIYEESDYDENDFSDDKLCGTIRVQKITYNNVNDTTTTFLEYVPYDDFKDMLENDNIDASNCFTVDEENNLIVAGWSKKSINVNVTYGDCYKNLDDLRNDIQEEYTTDEFSHKGDTHSYYKESAYQYKSIPYLEYISKYTLPFDFLITLDANIGNTDFCKELAKLAETSYITITLQEEYIDTTYTTTVEHTDYRKDFGNISAKFSGKVGDTYTTSKTDLTSQVSRKNRDYIFEQYNGVGTTASRSSRDGNKVTYFYNWVDKVDSSKQYELTYEIITEGDSNLISKTNPVYKPVVLQTQALERVVSFFLITTVAESSDARNESLVKDNIFVEKDGQGIRTITSNTYHIPDNAKNVYNNSDRTYEDVENLEDYSELKSNNYTVTTVTHTESNTYKLEVTEVDNWYEFYQKTYSEIEKEDSGQPQSTTTKELVIEANRQLVPSTEWNDRNYINNIINNEQAIKDFLNNNPDILDISDLTDIKMEITALRESYFTYEKDNITTSSIVTKYKRAGIEQELVQIKVQNDNKTAVLSLAADAFVTQNQEQDDKNNYVHEEVYETTDQYNNSFLYILSKKEYINIRGQLTGIDEWIYNNLTQKSSCKGITNLLKYLLFLYDGTDEGVTEYDVTLFKPGDFISNKLRGSAIMEWLKSYEYNDLRELRNGTMNYEYFSTNGYRHDSVKLDDDGKMMYRMYHLDVDTSFTTDHSWNFSYGILIGKTHPNGTNSQVLDNWALKAVGLNYDDLMADPENGWWDADIIDRLMLTIVEHDGLDRDKRHVITRYYEEKGLQLERYEIDAFIAVSYAHGNCQASSDSLELLRRYKEGTATKEEMINNFHTGSGFYPFLYEGWKGKPRGQALEAMFFEGRYILSTGEEINPFSFGGILLDWDGESYSSDLYTFPVYNQITGPWEGVPFGGPNGRPNVQGNDGVQKTIHTSGCGCCALASVLSGYIGEALTPDLLTEVLDDVYPDGSYYVPGEGSKSEYLSTDKVIGYLGCTATVCGSRQEAMNALESGYAVIGGESGHILAFVPASSEDRARGYAFRIIDSARGHNVLCKDFGEADQYVDGTASVIGIIYPPKY